MARYLLAARNEDLWRSWMNEDDPVLSVQNKGHRDSWANTRSFAFNTRKKYGTDRMYWKKEEELSIDDFDEDKEYRGSELDSMATDFLRKDSRRELCRRCSNYGEETGVVQIEAQYDVDGNPITDESDNQLYLNFEELQCKKGHRWFKGEGKERGIKGDNPILFEDHLAQRKRREIQTEQGYPEPHIYQGMYNRTHPEGRKVNSPEQRKKNGASYFR